MDGWLGRSGRHSAYRLERGFVTDTIEPNDVDCVLLLAADSAMDAAAEDELSKGLPFLEIALVGPEDFSELVNLIFASDRHGAPKGMIEVVS